jgi:predicted RND superfamily exporter protein
MNSLIRYRRILLILVLLVTAALSVGVKMAAEPDNSLSVWFLEDDPQLEEYRRFHELFGNDEVILLHVTDAGGIFQPVLLRQLEKMSSALEAQEGVARVYSVLNAQAALTTPEGAKVTRLFPDGIPEDAESLRSIQELATTNELLVDRLISADATQAMLWIQMAVMEDFDNQRDRIVDGVSATIDSHLATTHHAMGGMGVIYSGLNRITQRDFGIFISITYLLMFGVLWWIFRNARFVLATVGVITVGTVASLGTYGLLGHRLNMVTVLLPTLVIVLGIADAVHFPTALLDEVKKTPGDRDAAIRRGMAAILLPCIMTTLTTVAGFLALATAPMAVVRDLGIFAAIGVAAALVASTVFMLHVGMTIKEGTSLPDHPHIDSFLGGCANLLRTKFALVAALFVGVCALSLYGALHLKADTYTLGYLPDDHEVVTDHHGIVASWGDYFPVEYLVSPRQGLTVHSPEILDAIEGFERATTALPEIRNSFSHAALYRQAQGGYTPAIDVSDLEWDRALPQSRDNVFVNRITQDGDIARITMVGAMQSAADLGRILDQVDVLAKESFGDLAEVHATGYTPLYVQIVDYVLKSQTRAFFIALGIIFVLMLLWLRSLRLALLSLVVNALPVGIMLTTMFLMGLELDIASATIAAIVLGVAIDDTIHFLYHWRESERAGKSWDECLDYCYKHAGVPAVITTLLLVVGFPVLMLAQVKTVFFFGLLTTIAAVAALFSDLFALPLLLKVWPHRSQNSE